MRAFRRAQLQLTELHVAARRCTACLLELSVCGRSNGFAITCDVNGTINCNCRLTGMPDCTLTFDDPYKLDDCAFHPCVRYQRFETDQQLSFIPPDGKFKLLSFVGRCV